MVELRRVVASGTLGRVMHIEGHYSNENSGMHFSAWRESPGESPGGGMTGTGMHLLDAFVGVGGPVAEVKAQVVTFRPGRDPRDAASVMFRFASGLSGYFGLVRASPIYWRVHVFGDAGSVESLGETEVVVRSQGGKKDRRELPKVDSILAEMDAFADAVGGRAPYPITPVEMVNTIAAFEAIIQSMGTGMSVSINK